MKRQNYMIEISQYFSQMQAAVELNNSQGLYDINTFMEDIFVPILNITRDLNLTNLNNQRFNYPGVDLGDAEQDIYFQITSDNSLNKVKQCLETFERHHILSPSSTLFFLNIGKKVIRREPIKSDKFNFLETSLTNVLSEISSLSLEKQSEVLAVLREEFRDDGYLLPPPLKVSSIDNTSLSEIDQFFNKSFFSKRLRNELSDIICHLFKEFLRNQIQHGDDPELTMVTSRDGFKFSYSGKIFDPSIFHTENFGNGGAETYRQFFKFFGRRLKRKNVFSYDNVTKKNVITLTFNEPLFDVFPEDICIISNFDDLYENPDRKFCNPLTIDLISLAKIPVTDIWRLIIPLIKMYSESNNIIIRAKRNDYRVRRIVEDFAKNDNVKIVSA